MTDCTRRMQITIPATRAKNNFGELIRRVYTTGDHVIVEKDGMPVVIISPIYEPDLHQKTQKISDRSPSTDAKRLTQPDP